MVRSEIPCCVVPRRIAATRMTAADQGPEGGEQTPVTSLEEANGTPITPARMTGKKGAI